MEQSLVDEIQEAIEALQWAASQAAKMRQLMREQHLSFGLEFNHVDDDIAQIVSKLWYMKRLAERRG